MAEPGFWDKPEEAQKTVARLKSAKRAVDDYAAPEQSFKSLGELLDLAEAEADEGMLVELEQELGKLEAQVQALETRSLLRGEHDRFGALVIIHPGAGGTESQDWAEMLMRMYQRWAERRGYPVQLLDYQAGDEAGIKDATLEIDGEYAYGYLKAETGVHRLVRISPYDANARRHTSFSSVSVLPMLDNTIKVEIAPGDLRIDTMRAGGAGGQHVNKTESAVRITHLPTGLVVSCQDEKSQHKNKDRALGVLRSRLLDLRIAEQEAERARDRKLQVGTGDRSAKIRTYNFPQSRVTDHRIGYTTHALQQVLDGGLDEMIEKLKMASQAERERAA